MKRRTLVMLKEGEMNVHETNPEKPLARWRVFFKRIMKRKR